MNPAPPLESGAAIQLQGVDYKFKSRRVLNSIRLSVREGEIYGFLGLNGAGKTTTIRLILGLLRLSSGSIRLLGRPVEGHAIEVYRQVGCLMETYSPFPYLSAWDHLYQLGRVLDMEKEAVRKRGEELLDRLHLRAAAARKTRQYSLGMRRRLGIALALLGSPRLLILDEPANGLDPQGILDLRELLREIHRQEKVTVFFSSHHLGEVEELCQRVGIIHEGRMLCEGEVAKFLQPEKFGFCLRAGPAAEARAALRDAPGLREFREDGSGDRLGFLLDMDGAAVPGLAAHLVARGVEIHEIYREELNLEAFFKRKIEEARSGC